MGYQVRSFRLPNETYAAITEVKKACGYRTDTEALIHVVSEYDHKRKRMITDADRDAIAHSVMELIRQEFKQQLSQLAHSGAETERRCYLILDAVNTMLYDSSATFLMEASGQLRHEVIRQSEENYTKMLGHGKQIRDNRRWKEMIDRGRDPDSGTG